MTRPPPLDDAPGHRWQSRADGRRWVCVWIARTDIAKDGYKPKTHRVWPPVSTPDAELDDAATLYIQSECQRLQDEMHAWNKGKNEKSGNRFDGTIDSLINCYKSDPDSDYQKIRYRSTKTYNSHLGQISKTVGKRRLQEVKARDLKRWFEKWSADGEHIPRASGRMTMLRMILGFGAAILEDEDCQRVRGILEILRFEQGKRRKSIITAEQVIAFCKAAREAGAPSMALAERLKYELIVRPKDVIGEWLPMSEPGMSAITRSDGHKWLYGFDWREVDEHFNLVHRISKSLRGKRAIATPDAGKTKTYKLHLYPGVIEELALMAGVSHVNLRRDMFPAAGPMVVCEDTGLPYPDSSYRKDWRKLATAAGIPTKVQSRDARAGGGTHAKRLGAKPEDIQQAMGHSNVETTWIYLRDDDETTAEIAALRGGKHTANDTGE
ncbi:tyrosine-type recombinase/integrase [Bradyrhizobium sp. Tv2a-2]|uniref:site-specific integrase n=1 Tax=Bradyrhizobium sp. Tv2a-2 TaxID=113395 RepID=UPI0003FD40BB|nr:tyrosine-type recombinase/integrase [Bradyrhizobium sp. Tv2a-2]